MIRLCNIFFSLVFRLLLIIKDVFEKCDVKCVIAYDKVTEVRFQYYFIVYRRDVVAYVYDEVWHGIIKFISEHFRYFQRNYELA